MTNDSGTKPRKSKWRSIAIEVALFVIVVCRNPVPGKQRDMVSGAAPALQGVTLAGQPYKLPAHPDHPVLVHFWATWCPVVARAGFHCRHRARQPGRHLHRHASAIPEEVVRYNA